MDNSYQDWLNGRGCCCGGFIHIEPCDKHKDVCDCDNILLEISKLHTDDEVLQEQIDELSGCCSGGSVTVDNELSLISTNPVENKVITEALNGKLDASAYTPTTQVQSDWEQTNTSAVDYIKNKPNIPVVPTNVSAFINDMGYLTEHQPLSGYVTNAEFIQVTSNLQQQIDSLRSAISGCCGQTGQTYTRWITMTGASDYWCSGTTKMSEEKEQTSTDNINWTDTGNIRSGNTVLETNCEDCGYTPPTPPISTDKAFVFNTYSGDTNVIKIKNSCDSSDIIWRDRYGQYYISGCSTTIDISFVGLADKTISYYSTADTSVIAAHQYEGTDATQFNILSGCTGIGDYAFANNPKLTFVGIPASYRCQYYPTIVAGQVNTQNLICYDSGSTYVTSIGNYAFANNPNLEQVSIYPCYQVPTLGTGVFDNCPKLAKIVVPSGMESEFRTAWPQYASLIQGGGTNP